MEKVRGTLKQFVREWSAEVRHFFAVRTKNESKFETFQFKSLT
jgi:hypothetical protein